jgi:hypothetical protein
MYLAAEYNLGGFGDCRSLIVMKGGTHVIGSTMKQLLVTRSACAVHLMQWVTDGSRCRVMK